MVNSQASLSGLILAGGQAQRMGGLDKGLLLLHGQPLVAHVIARLQPQVSSLCISANRNLSAYQALGLPVLPDSLPNFPGPLAGILSGLQHIQNEYLLVTPCDAPLLPKNLAQGLWQAMQAQPSKLSVAHDGRRLQPIFALLHKDLQADLAAYLGRGERRLQAWMLAQNAAIADFSEQPEAFTNLNQLKDVEILQHEKFGFSRAWQSP